MIQKIYRVKGGAGAAILPPNAPAPQLTNVTLRIPNPAYGYDAGASDFWRRYLPALRYHNLTLPIKVEQTRQAAADFAPTITLEFEATTREALETQQVKPKYTDQQALERWKGDLSRTRQEQKEQEFMGGPVIAIKKDSLVNQVRQQQQEIGIPEASKTSVGAITTKAQPAADPSAPSTTSPPVTMFQRSVTLGLRGRNAWDIWSWFQGVTKARPYKLNREERSGLRGERSFQEKASKDRERVKIGVDAMKREKEELRRAKEAAERSAEV